MPTRPTRNEENYQGAGAAPAEARLMALLDSMHEGAWILGMDSRIEFANHRLAQFFGLPPQEITAGSLQSDVLEKLRPNLEAPDTTLGRWRQLQESPEQVSWDEIELRRPRRRILERFARPIFGGQNLLGRLELFRDITGERLLEDKVVQREKLAAIGQLLTGVAHELNNPLTAVGGYAHLLAAAALPEPLQEKAERLRQEAERAGRIVANLLLFARGSKPEKQWVDLHATLERILSLRAYELRVENIRVVRDYAAALPSVLADPSQLEQVFLNIVLNAEQAIRRQRERGTLTLRTVAQPPGRICVEIANDGPAIAPDLLPRIFDPFFTTKPPVEGTGLGLYIARGIVREHGGEIVARSGPAGGAIFVIELPALVPPAPAREPEPAPVVAQRPAPQGRRILVVDDEPSVAYLIADALEQQGYAVRVHTESQRALTEALAQSFDLAICDIRMPELDGQAFYRILRHQESPLADRLLFTTGDTLARETTDFLEQVGAPFLPKPFHVDELQERVRVALEQNPPLEVESGAPLPVRPRNPEAKTP
ncbi:MAG TPA: ATP-binding protein [Candidatus Acidoferrales bacterium]|nr:ATP-binding protein [Candidatus Acidoferrales bacterium]